MALSPLPAVIAPHRPAGPTRAPPIMESPGSPLSELSSDDFQEDVKTEDRSLSVDTFHDADHDSARPAKRQRTGPSNLSNFRATSAETTQPHEPEPDIYISEDTEGSVPASPNHPGGFGGMQDEESLGQEQVTVCKWEGCEAGDLGNMDKLVDHLHDDHIGTRQKKYSCEWSDCARKGIPHASGYALRAHMRSHTREKPFYCTLPECDRAFTRSDALAKHMRTVHETEALRPSDPVPKHHSSNPSNKAQRLRLVFKNNGTDKASSPMPASPHSQSTAGAGQQQQQQQQQQPPAENEYEHNNIAFRPVNPSNPNGPRIPKFPADIRFTPQELALPAPELARLLRRQLHWAAQEAEELKAEVGRLEKRRREEWTAKELVMENVMEAELGRMESADRLLREEVAGAAFREALRDDVKISKSLDVQPPQPAWRQGDAAEKEIEGGRGRGREREGFEEIGALVGMAGMAGAPKFDVAGDAAVERRPEHLGIRVAGGP